MNTIMDDLFGWTDTDTHTDDDLLAHLYLWIYLTNDPIKAKSRLPSPKEKKKKIPQKIMGKVVIFLCIYLNIDRNPHSYLLIHKHVQRQASIRQTRIHGRTILNCGLIWFLTHSYLGPFLCKFTTLLHPLILSVTALATLATGQILKQPRRLWSCWIQMMTRLNKEAFHTDSSVTPGRCLEGTWWSD